jgi:hypothetical protein
MNGIQNDRVGSATHYTYIEARPTSAHNTESAHGSVALNRFKAVCQEPFLVACACIGGAAIKKCGRVRCGVCDAGHVY